MDYKKDVLVYDLETPKGCFLASFYDFEKGFIDFIIWEQKNQLYEFIQFLENNKHKYYVGFNNLNFDNQVIEWIYKNYDEFALLSNLEITEKIYKYASKCIENSNYSLWSDYREDELTFKPIDVFKIQHFDNKNRRVGLKRLEVEMDMDDVREFEISPDKQDFNETEIKDLIDYCHNDIFGATKNYLYLIGETDNKIYQGSNQIELRESLTKTFGINCLNFSNSKYGDEIMKKVYAQELGLELKDLPKKGTFRKKLVFKECIPDYISFKTKELQNFLKELKKVEIGVKDDYEKEIKIGNRRHTFALGGIHSITENEFLIEDDEYELIDVDVSGYYVWTIISQLICPKHLNKKAFLKIVEWLYNERIKLKPLVKTNPEYKSLVAGYKEAAVSIYGKMGDMTNWMYDPQARLHICIGGQLSILMLIEEAEMNGYQCFMSNTDGASFRIKKTEKDNFFKMCELWEKKTTYTLEYAYFKEIYFESINSYIGIKTDGEIKKKNSFLTDTELHKDKSNRIIALALEQYFVNKIDVEIFINNFTDIKQFCARSSAGKTYFHEGYENNKSFKLPKLIRYYVSKKGIHIKKIVREDNDTNANDAMVQPADKLKTVVNLLTGVDLKWHLNNVDRQWYIEKAKEIIFRIEKGRKLKKGVIQPKEQLSLF